MNKSVAALCGLGTFICIILGLTLSPAANAAFTGKASASASFTTATLAVPDTFPVTGTCAKSPGHYTVTISVSANFPAVPYTNYLELRVSSPLISPWSGDLSQVRTYTTTVTNNAGKRSVWTFDIYGEYRIPGTTKAWTTKTPFRQTVTCN